MILGGDPAVKHRVTGAVPNFRSLPYRLLAGDVPRVLTSLAQVKPRDRGTHPQPIRVLSTAVGTIRETC